jgi:hypothetical protein
MIEDMLSNANIQAVIRSRDDLSACGNDGTTYRTMKAAGPEAIKFMKPVCKATIRVIECSTHGRKLRQFPAPRRENEPIRRTGRQSQSATACVEYTRA